MARPALLVQSRFFLVVGLFLLPALARSQTATLPAALQRPESSRPERQTELRRELERRAEVLDAQSAVVRIVAKLIGPAVVHIEADVPTAANSSPERGPRLEEAGSGVIIEYKNANYVLTNRHVVRDAAIGAIRISLSDGRRIQPTKVLADPPTDIAVLAIEAPDLTPAALGDSRRVQIGDFVLAFGSPFGLSHSVSFGIISAKGRRTLRLEGGGELEFQDFLQTDAAINPGSSGGPLVNLRGEVIGIDTAIASVSGRNEGVGFAIPSDMAIAIAKQLIETGKVTRAFLGVKLTPNFGPAMAAELGLPRPIGACVTSIVPNSPAESAKLQAGDVILEFNNTPVEDKDHLVNLVSLTAVGKTVPLVVFRDRKAITVVVEVADAGEFKK